MANATAYNSSHIRTMESLEHIASNPAMYLGADASDPRVLTQLFKEPLDNVIDETYIDPSKPFPSKFMFFVKGNRYQIAMMDSGRGVPLDKIEASFTKYGTSGKWDGAYTTSIGIHGVGAKATAALSSQFAALSYRREGMGLVYVVDTETKRSEVIKDRKIPNVLTPCGPTGTLVFHEPSRKIFSCIDDMIASGLADMHKLILFNNAHVPNLQVQVILVDKLITQDVFKQPLPDIWNLFAAMTGTVVNVPKVTPDQYVRQQFSLPAEDDWRIGPLVKALDTDDASDRLAYEASLFLPVKFAKHSFGIVGSVNRHPLADYESFHISGLMDKLKQHMVQFLEESDQKAFFSTVYRLPLSGTILVQWKGAKFVNQTKTAYREKEFLVAYQASLAKQLSQVPESSWEQLFSLIKEHFEQEFSRYTNKSLNAGKNLKNVSSVLQCQYRPCRSGDKNVIELLIAEGISAGGYLSQVVDKNFQAVFMIRGKPTNTFKTKPEDLIKDIIYKELIRLVGVSPRDTNLDNMNFSKLGIITDADPDGYHIAALLVGMFYTINPLILSQGRVFISNPPLYILHLRQETKFPRDQRALQDTLIKGVYEPALDIFLKTKGTMIQQVGDDYRNIVYVMERMGELIADAANKLVIQPALLENLIHVVDCLDPVTPNVEEIRKQFQLDRVIHHKESNTLILLTGGIEHHIPLNNLQADIRKYLLPELQSINWTSFDVYVSTRFTSVYKKQPMTITQLHQTFQQLREDPSLRITIRRMKGLGEMDKDVLRETAVDPNTRNQTTITSIGDLSRIYGMLSPDMKARKGLVTIRDLRDTPFDR